MEEVPKVRNDVEVQRPSDESEMKGVEHPTDLFRSLADGAELKHLPKGIDKQLEILAVYPPVLGEVVIYLKNRHAVDSVNLVSPHAVNDILDGNRHRRYEYTN
jgi:hypothetical protein